MVFPPAAPSNRVVTGLNDDHDDDTDSYDSACDSSDFDDEDSFDEVEYDDSRASLPMHMHTNASSPAIMAMRNQLNGCPQPPLVDPQERRRSELMRVDSQPSMMMVNNMNSGLPLALLQRMQKAECVIGNANIDSDSPSDPSIPTSNDLLGLSEAPPPQKKQRFAPKAVPRPPSSTAPTITSAAANCISTDPQVHLKMLLEQQGIAYKTYPALQLENSSLRMGEASSDGFEYDDSRASLPMHMHTNASSPAIMAMHDELNGYPQPPLVDPEERRRSELMRVDSQPNLMMADNMNSGLPLALLQRMQKAECVIGNANIDSDSPSDPSIPTSNDLLGLSEAPPPQKKQRFAPKAVPRPPSSTAPTITSAAANCISTDPQVHLKMLLEQQGIAYKTYPALQLENFFLKMGEVNVAGYDMPKAAAVRTNDVNALREMLHQGQTLQVCNRFGESIINNACRRGSLDIMRFLLKEAAVSLKVVDDYGRTALHDACWTHTPCFNLVKLLLEHCPDLLLIQDKRGSTPLQYVRRQNWREWCQFLEQNKTKLIPRDLE